MGQPNPSQLVDSFVMDRQTHATESITHMGNKYGGKSAGNVAAIYWSITGRIRSAV